jgi:protein-S-isoprenylcysteine O-methyltransferase Ste14
MQDTSQDSAGVMVPPPLIYAVPLLLGLYLHAKSPLPFLPRQRRAVLSSLLLIGGALTLVSLTFRAMKQADTPVNPRQPVTTLLVDGPFRISRNPIYLSLTMLYTGIAMLVNTLWPMLFLPLVLLLINRVVIDREERYLERKFGRQYVDYKARVRRWI